MIANYYSRIKSDPDTSGSTITVTPEDGEQKVYIGTSKRLHLASFVDGVEQDNYNYVCSINCGDNIATCDISDNIVTLTVVNERGNIGVEIELSVQDTVNNLSVLSSHAIKGWV